jgi:hypothetical protein
MNASRLLSIYLRDHHAGAVAGLNLARRVASENEGTAYAADLADLAAEIEEDRLTLESIMDHLGVGRDQLKDLAASAGEKLGRLKPNGRWREYSPLSRLVELEALALGVSAKLALWRSLREAVGEGIDGIAFATLETRAEGQRARLEDLRRRAAGDALGED